MLPVIVAQSEQQVYVFSTPLGTFFMNPNMMHSVNWFCIQLVLFVFFSNWLVNQSCARRRTLAHLTKSHTPLHLFQQQPTTTDAQTIGAKGNSKTATKKKGCKSYCECRAKVVPRRCKKLGPKRSSSASPVTSTSGFVVHINSPWNFLPTSCPAFLRLASCTNLRRACKLAKSCKCVALILHPAFVQGGFCLVVFFFFFFLLFRLFCVLSSTFSTTTTGMGELDSAADAVPFGKTWSLISRLPWLRWCCGSRCVRVWEERQAKVRRRKRRCENAKKKY